MKRMDRRRFLRRIGKGGIGLCLGGFGTGLFRWREQGISLMNVRRSSLVMGSVIDIQVVAEKENEGYEAIRRALDIFRDLDGKLSMYDPGSEMGMLSRLAGKKPLPVSGDAMTVLEYAKTVWRETRGLFDVTVEPAMQRWGFRCDPQEMISRPTDKELRQLERLIGSERLILSSGQAFLQNDGMAVDLGGIAGGYALDKAIGELKKADIAAGFINFSGDIHCFGHPLDKEGWPVHILDPKTLRPLENPVILNNEALSTSGSYQNRRESSNDSSWGHLITPGSATPVSSGGSVTAIHRSAMTADAWSTAGFVGADRPKHFNWIVQ